MGATGPAGNCPPPCVLPGAPRNHPLSPAVSNCPAFSQGLHTLLYPPATARCTQSTVRSHLPGTRQAPCEVLGHEANKMWTIQWEGFRAWLGLTNYRISGRLPPLAAAAHGKGKGETVSVPVDLGVVWGCRWLLLVLRLWVCGVLVGGMGGAGRRELPPRVAQGAVRGRM